MKRSDGRGNNDLRNIKIQRDFIKYAEGSCFIEWGNTKIVCTATADKNPPPFLRGSKEGWVSAEYGMLPRSTQVRISKDRISGRNMEIQRLIGRSLRSIINTKKIGERTIWIDCSVIQADGGTRIASIVGGFIALTDAIDKLYRNGIIEEICITDFLGAVSVGIYKGKPILDLHFIEDSHADVDMNIIMKGNGEFVEVQGTGEHNSFSQSTLYSLIDLAKPGIDEIIDRERNIFKDVLPDR